MTKTYAQLNKEIAALQAAAKKLYTVELRGVVDKVNQLVAKYDLTAADLRFPGPATSRAKPQAVKRQAPAAATTSAAKYSDGQGNVWGGRGPRPAWLRAAIDAGRTLESFGSPDLQSASIESNPMTAANASKTSKAGKASKATGKRPAKFKDGAGNSWSGRGSRPRWLQAALKKRGTKIEDFLINADASSVPDAPDSGVTAASTKPTRKAASRGGKAVKKEARVATASAAAAPKESKTNKRAAPAKSKSKEAPTKVGVKTPAAKPPSSNPATARKSGATAPVKTAQTTGGAARKAGGKVPPTKPAASKNSPAASKSPAAPSKKRAPVKTTARHRGKKIAGASLTVPPSDAGVTAISNQESTAAAV